ncbi:S-layer homology domain-containing protein [Candidatus Peribacteria bacterium]|nr:S-layer homology domain-containing protein [Candidatus Peribacteria bacterium]
MKWCFFSLGIMGSLGPASLAMAAFTDVDIRDDYANEIHYLQEEGIVQGYSDGTYRPTEQVNRVEFLKMLQTASTEETADERCTTSKPFSDTDQSAWYAASVQAAVCAGLVDGYPDGSFRPSNPINYAEAAKILVQAAASLSPDLTQASTWYTPYTSVLQASGLRPPSITMPDASVTRAEMAFLIARMRQQGQFGSIITPPAAATNPLSSTEAEAVASACVAAGGNWLSAYSECEYGDESFCSTWGGSFNDCASPCRHDEDAAVCILMCVATCQFTLADPPDPLANALPEYTFDYCGTRETYAAEPWMASLEKLYEKQYPPLAEYMRSCRLTAAGCDSSFITGGESLDYEACYSSEGELFLAIAPHSPDNCGQILRYDTAQEFLMTPEGDYCADQFGKRDGDFIWFSGKSHTMQYIGKYYYSENTVEVTYTSAL